MTGTMISNGKLSLSLRRPTLNFRVRLLALLFPLLLAPGCAQVSAPDGRTVDVPTVTPPVERYRGLNEHRDAVTRVRLGKDVLVPQALREDPLPEEEIGPFELRGETLASALQLILDDYDVSIAFESDAAMNQRITVANLRGKVGEVVDRVCELANLYCHHERNVLTVKDTETFVVDLPPLNFAASGALGTAAASYDQISTGLAAIVGTTPTVDTTTRVMIYTATQKAHHNAMRYFDRLRKNTALIIFETHIWEVNLSNENRTGIDWSGLFNNVGNFNIDITLPGGAPTGVATPISITPTYTGNSDITSEGVLEFISEHGTVKTVSQPQLTVLSGSSASLEVQQNENFVSGISRSTNATTGVDTVSTTTETVETGLLMTVTSAWDRSTVYGTLDIQLDELLNIDEFTPDVNTTIQLPKTTARNLQTQIRVRPGDAVLIAGLVTERDDYSASGPGFMKPLVQTARKAKTTNTELVFLLRPRVIAFIQGDEADTVPVIDAVQERLPGALERKEELPPATEDLTENVEALFRASGVEGAPVPEPVPSEPAIYKKSNALPLGISPEALAPVDLTGENQSPDKNAPEGGQP